MNSVTDDKQISVDKERAGLPNRDAAAASHFQLPEKPVVIIEASRGWIPLNLQDLWQYRDLLYILTMRDIKVRYKQTLLGASWAIIQPLFAMIIFTVFFGTLAGMPSDNIPYPVFAYAGLLPWIFFSNAVTNSGNSLVGNANLITKIYFPRMIIPMASVASGLVDFLVAFLLLVGLMIYYGVGLTVNILMLPVLLIITAMLATGVGMWMSALNVKFRDIRYALPFVVQLGLFASGIITPIPEKWRWLLAVNPVAALIDAFRAATFGKPFDWLSLSIATIVTCAILFYAALTFRRMEKGFADVI